MLSLATRNNVKVRETTCGNANGVDRINSAQHRPASLLGQQTRSVACEPHVPHCSSRPSPWTDSSALVCGEHPPCGRRGIQRTPRRGERGAQPVTGVLEQPAAVRLDRGAQHLVMGGQRRPYAIVVGLPPDGSNGPHRWQKRHHPRRSNPCRSGYPAESHSRYTPASHIGRIRPRTPTPEVRRSATGRRYGTCWMASGDTILT